MRITDGNLSVHARKLEDAGYIACTKSFAGRLPKTEYRLSPSGRRALEKYLDHMEALDPRHARGLTKSDHTDSGKASNNAMQKSVLRIVPNPKLHVAILLDGNGRWAASRGLARSEGHRAGVEAVRRVVRAAPSLGIGTLTLYAFSSNNWERPAGEVASLLALARGFLPQ